MCIRNQDRGKGQQRKSRVKKEGQNKEMRDFWGADSCTGFLIYDLELTRETERLIRDMASELYGETQAT